jgi:hypothetical protein
LLYQLCFPLRFQLLQLAPALLELGVKSSFTCCPGCLQRLPGCILLSLTLLRTLLLLLL